MVSKNYNYGLEIVSNFDVQALHLDFLNIVKWTCKEAQACMPVTISLETNYIVERMKQGHTKLYVNWNAIESQIYIWYTLIAELYVYHSVIRTTSSGRFLHVDLRDSMIIKKDWYENASENAQKWNLAYYY